nr:hypothetical protein [uncultured Blautia sp.]
MGRICGLVLFFLGLGMVLGLLIAQNIIVIIAAVSCLLCGYHLFCR